MKEKNILWILDEIEVIITDGHFVLTSGRHSDTYVDKDALSPHTKYTSRLCREIAKQFENDGVETVIAPAIGGIPFSMWTAHHLTELSGREVFATYAEKSDNGGFVIRPSHHKFITGRKTLVVEDVLTTGDSAKKVIGAVREVGGKIVGLGAICNRGGVTKNDIANVPKLVALVNSLRFSSWDKETCPLCKQGIPVNTRVGKGAKPPTSQT